MSAIYMEYAHMGMDTGWGGGTNGMSYKISDRLFGVAGTKS